MATGRKEQRNGRGLSRFYCEVCGREVPPEDKNCPYCGTPFYAVKCPRCGYVDKAMSFIYGCPSCGYLSPQQRKETAGKKSKGSTRKPAKGSVGSPDPEDQISASKDRSRGSKEGSDLFTTFLLVFLLLAIGGLVVVYVWM